MIVPLFAMLSAMAQAESPARQAPVAHPRIRCWRGERSWAPPGEQPSPTVYFHTEQDLGPDRIEHNRDQIFEGHELIQNYNFIDYHFSNDGNPLLARTYLDDEPWSVGILFRREAPPHDADEARRLIAPDVLCYLQKRFRTIDALTATGYQQLWTDE